MIKNDDRIEFIFEKVIKEPSEEDSGTSVELFVRYEKEGPFGPTVSFTEELEPSKRDKSEWTYLPISFVKEIAEYLYSKGAIEKLEGSSEASKGSGKSLPAPVVAKPKNSTGSLSAPQLNTGRPSPVSYTNPPNPNNIQRPALPVHGPKIAMGQNGNVEIQHSQPPYQSPLTNSQMASQPQPMNEYQGYQPQHYSSPQEMPPQEFNPFGGNVATANYQSPLQSFSGAMVPPQQPQQNNVPQQNNLGFDQNNIQSREWDGGIAYSQSESNDLTSILNDDVQETPPHLKGDAVSMLQQRAQALDKQINGSEELKIRPQGQTRVDPSTLVPRQRKE